MILSPGQSTAPANGILLSNIRKEAVNQERGFTFYKDSTPQAPQEESAQGQDYELLAHTFMQEYLVYRSYPSRTAVLQAINHVERSVSKPLTIQEWQILAKHLLEHQKISLLDFDGKEELFFNFVHKHHQRWSTQQPAQHLAND